MTQSDLILDDLAPPRRNRVLRLVILVIMTLCGLMMAAILLSEPKVAAGLQSAIGQVSERFTTTEAPLDDPDRGAELGLLDEAPAQAVKPDQPVVKPPVNQMPVNRIPVRRAGN